MSAISIPDGVERIGDWAFYGCSRLTSIDIPNTLKSIGTYAFQGCYSLKSILIPTGLTSIGADAFLHCNNLSTVHISDISAWCNISLSNIGSCPTVNGGNLYLNGEVIKDLVLPNDVSSISDYTFYNCYGLTSITLPHQLKMVKKGAFKGCSNLTSLTIPASVEFIFQEAFADCNALENVKAKPGTPPFLYENSFSNYSIPLEVPRGCKEDYQTSQGWKNFTTISESEKGYYNLIYLVDNVEYKSYKIEEGEYIIPEVMPNKEGYTFSGWSEIPDSMPAHDVTVIGTFSVNKYKLTYKVDDAEYKTYEVEYGSTITAEAAPTKEGYTFSGWSEIPETMPSHDVTVTGTFSINKYKLTYKVDDAEYKTYEVEYGSTITAEAAPTKEGYTFSGWSEIPETMPAHDVTVIGTFSVNKYKLTYQVDGAEYKTYEVEYGSTITAEAAPTKEGYTFSGWSEIPETMPAHDVTVTGTFSINKYKLAYMVDDAEYKTYEVEYGSTITAEAAPTREGYTFSGWSEIPETMPAHDVTVTGTFSINKYKLIYTVDGEEYKSSEVEYGATITAEAAPTKEGYTFSGWSEIPQTMPAHNVTVTGTFSINKYKLTYMVDNAEYKTYEVEYGSTITAEAAPTKEGYTFSGWSEIPETMPAHDVTVTGTFSINKYKLTYKVDYVEYKTYEVEYGSTITAEAAPTKEGYTFSGWSEIPSTMPAHDVTVTGSFTINSYKLTYMIDDKVYKETIYEYGATITPEPQPEGDYVSFEWVDLPKTMPAKDVTVYANYQVSAITNVMMTKGNTRIYSPNGKRLNKMQKGLNILRMSNGKTKKVVVK